MVARKLDTTTATTSELNCTVVKPGSPGEIQCTFDVTSTAGGRLVEFEISDGATTQIVRSKFLIDNEGPKLPQVKINMNNAIPEITLPQFPLDKGGSQTSICFLSYQQKDGKGEWKDEIQPGVALALSELPPISESHKVHTVKVQCQDKL